MRVHVEDWAENRIAVRLALASEEIGPLQRNLGVLRRDSSQHFHISSDGSETRLADIEISVMSSGQDHNMSMTSVALAPGTEITLSAARGSHWKFVSFRSGAAALLGVVGVVAAMGAASSAFVTFATSDYRPILIRGVWDSTLALLAFQASGAFAKGWKARVVALGGTLAVLVSLAEILRRLTPLTR